MKNKVTEKWRKDHKKKGLCIDCNKKALPGYIRCQYHLDKQAEAARERRGSQ